MKPPKYVEPETFDHYTEEQKPVHATEISDSLIGAVRRAYRDTQPNEDVATDGHLRLNFHTGWYPVRDDETKYAIGFIGEYNRFDGETVGDAVAMFPKDTLVSIGRESSPVLYFWTESPSKALTALEKLNPDETSIFPNAREYPNPSDSRVIWVDDPERIRYLRNTGNTRYTRWIDSPVGTIRHPATGLRPTERNAPTLIRAWWD